MKATVNISKKNFSSLIAKLDNNNYFQLGLKGQNGTSRKDLFDFAMALGVSQGYHTTVDNKDGLYRTESIGNSLFLYSSVFYCENVAGNALAIDEVTNHDKIIDFAEEYANVGFNVLEEKVRNESEEAFMYELLDQADTLYQQYEADFSSK